MKLYHGTSESNLSNILKKGLRPQTKGKGNWEQYPSRSDMVYLTTAYAPYFALSVEGGGNPVVLEIDADLLDQDQFYPDEDFISQTISKQEKIPLKTVHNKIRRQLKSYQHHWRLSIEKMGNCCYQGTILPTAITRYAMWEIKKQQSVSMMAMDPCITPLNYLILSEKYKGLIAWLFGDRPDIPGDSVSSYIPEYHETMMGNPFYAERVKYLEQASKNRDGITVKCVEHLA